MVIIVKYYDISKLQSLNPDYAFIVGGRSNGKSHAVANMLIKQYMETGAQFVRIVRYIFDLQDKYVSDYFDEANLKFAAENYGKRIYYDSPNYYIADVESKSNKSAEIIGYTLALSSEQKYKSNQYDRVRNIVVEEFALLNPEKYLSNEAELFLSLLSTIVRMRNNVKVWLVGNTISKYNPYFTLLNVNIDKLQLKPGDIKKVEQPELGYDVKPNVYIEFATMAYETAAEIPRILKIGKNETATTGLFMKPEDVIEPSTLKYKHSIRYFIVQIGSALFIWRIFPCFTYWERYNSKSASPDLVVKTMCYDRKKYYWYALEQFKNSGFIIPNEWYYDSEETKQYVYENIIKEHKI